MLFLMDPPSDTPIALPWPAVVENLRTYAVFTLNADGIIGSWNRGVYELFGYEEREFVGQPGRIIFTPEDRVLGAVEQELAVALEQGEAMDDRWHMRKDGSRFWVNGIMHCVRDANGTVLGFLKMMRDQTEKLGMDARIQESEERFAKAFRMSPTPIAVFELPGGLIIEVNEAFTRTFRLERSEAIGRVLPEIGIEPKDDPIGRVRDELVAGRSVGFEAPFRRGDGETGYGTFAFESIVLGGEPHAVMLVHDVTGWRRTQEQLEQQNQLVTAILDSLPGVFYMLKDGHLVRWNREFERVTGFSSEELAVVTAGDLAVEGEDLREHFEIAFRNREYAVEAHLRTREGAPVPYLLTGRRVVIDGEPLVLGVGVDISDQHRVRKVLERRAQEQAAYVDLSARSLSSADLDSVLEFAVRRIAETLGAEHVQIVEFQGEDVDIRASFHGESPASASALMASARFAGDRRNLINVDAGTWSREELQGLGVGSGIRVRIQGRERPFGIVEALSVREGAFSEEDVRFLRGAAFLLAGAVEQRRLIRQLAHRADHDDLTGLLTRIAFERRLVDALERAKRQGAMVAVLFLDLDRFKNVNDSLGHQAGDEVLRIVAKRLREVVRSWDVVARHGGDEFVLFLPDIESGSEVAHVTARLLELFEEPFTVAGRQLMIGTTVGIALFPEDGVDAETLLRAADTALYEGKARGRSSFHFFTREQNERVKGRLELEADLRQAIDGDEFDMLYQPQVGVADGDVRGVEALIRWRHPQRGHLAPRDFLPVAEAIGLAVPLGEWILGKAFADHAAWRGQPGRPERVAVNVTTRYFLQPSFPDTLASLAREAGLDPNEIEIEVSESTLLQEIDLVTGYMRALKDRGFGLVLDDFGAVVSPLARLRFLPLDRLKVDDVLTQRLQLADERRLAEAIVQVALGLGIVPVAEGVETPEQHHAVRELGFQAAQGRYYAEPMAHGEVRQFLEEHGG